MFTFELSWHPCCKMIDHSVLVYFLTCGYTPPIHVALLRPMPFLVTVISLETLKCESFYFVPFFHIVLVI